MSKRSFPPPSDEQIERLYPELSGFEVELGGRGFTLRELPAIYEKKILRLVEQKLPALVAEILKFEDIYEMTRELRSSSIVLISGTLTALDTMASIHSLQNTQAKAGTQLH